MCTLAPIRARLPDYTTKNLNHANLKWHFVLCCRVDDEPPGLSQSRKPFGVRIFLGASGPRPRATGRGHGDIDGNRAAAGVASAGVRLPMMPPLYHPDNADIFLGLPGSFSSSAGLQHPTLLVMCLQGYVKYSTYP